VVLLIVQTEGRNAESPRLRPRAIQIQRWKQSSHWRDSFQSASSQKHKLIVEHTHTHTHTHTRRWMSTTVAEGDMHSGFSFPSMWV